MIYVVLVLLGLCFGSFVNALVWRLHEQTKKPGAKKSDTNLSIVSGRSICPHCKHELAAKDLVPVWSWLILRGKCRYCGQPISWQYPVVEATAAALFVFSFVFWPQVSDLRGNVLFAFWLVFLTGFLALAVYDLRWFLLPNKLVFPLIGLAVAQTLVVSGYISPNPDAFVQAFWGFLVGGGIFYVLFQVSGGKWIGGGDVKLGMLLGILLGGPTNSLLMIFLASVLGTVVAVPLLLSGKLKRTSHLPFGPMLIAAAFIVYLFGESLVNWYNAQLLM